MSVSGVSSSSAYQPITSASNQGNPRGAAMKTLVDAIKSGDLDSAKTAFAALQKNQPGATAGAGNATNSTASQPDQDFAAIGKALQSGDVQGAQQALSKLQQDHKAAQANGTQGTQQAHGPHGAHHHHGGHKVDADSVASTTDAAGVSAENTDATTTYKADASATQSTSTPGTNVDVVV